MLTVFPIGIITTHILMFSAVDIYVLHYFSFEKFLVLFGFYVTFGFLFPCTMFLILMFNMTYSLDHAMEAKSLH